MPQPELEPEPEPERAVVAPRAPWAAAAAGVSTIVRARPSEKELASRGKDRLKGPLPLLRSQAEVNALYDCLQALGNALDALEIPWLIICGSILGAVRSHSLLFCDDDVDIGVFENDYPRVLELLPAALKGVAQFKRRPWPAADRVRPLARTQVWIDVFVLRRYDSAIQLREAVSTKANGAAQPLGYVDAIMQNVESAAVPCARWPLYHYDHPKAIELWPREFFTAAELLPLRPRSLHFGPLLCPGPAHPVSYLRHAYGVDALDVWILATQHAAWSVEVAARMAKAGVAHLADGEKRALLDVHYRPVAHSRLGATPHSREELAATLAEADRWDGRLDPTAALPPRCARAAPKPKPTWFGAAMATFANGSADAPVFTPGLLAVMEPHVQKARSARKQAEVRSPGRGLDGAAFRTLCQEACGTFAPREHRLGDTLGAALGLGPAETHDLSLLHEVVAARGHVGKHELTANLRIQAMRCDFHTAFDGFVRRAVLPWLALAAGAGDVGDTVDGGAAPLHCRVQAFPVIRVILPGEFSLGVHCDSAYGHGAASLNIVVPLTASADASALHAESTPGAEDWHVLCKEGEGSFARFWGGRCLHFAGENTTPRTRVSLDLRVVWGDTWEEESESSYVHVPGYFLHWTRLPSGDWDREGPLPAPDARLGYPFGGIKPAAGIKP